MIKAVIDTNIFWVSVSRRSSSHWLFQRLIAGDFTLAVTTDILHEYEEIISQKIGSDAAHAVMETLDYLPNVELVTRYYRWQLIVSDPDDRNDGPRQICRLFGCCEYNLSGYS